MSVDTWKSPSMQHKHDEVALKITLIKNIKFKINKIRTTRSVYRLRILQQKPKLGRTKPGPHAACKLNIHSCAISLTL